MEQLNSSVYCSCVPVWYSILIDLFISSYPCLVHLKTSVLESMRRVDRFGSGVNNNTSIHAEHHARHQQKTKNSSQQWSILSAFLFSHNHSPFLFIIGIVSVIPQILQIFPILCSRIAHIPWLPTRCKGTLYTRTRTISTPIQFDAYPKI